jgi:hypothetical protein
MCVYKLKERYHLEDRRRLKDNIKVGINTTICEV